MTLRIGRKKARARRILRVIVVSLIVWSLLAWCFAQALMVRAELARADALVVLAGSDAYIERTQKAAQLFFEGRASKILLTNDSLVGGWSSAQQRNPFFIERAADELRRAGVPAEKVELLPKAVHNTYEEAQSLREYASAHRLRSILIVTSAYHSRRALWTFRRVFKGSDVEIGLEPPPPGQQTPQTVAWWCYPYGWRIVALEYPKFVYYWLKYR